MPLLEKSLEGAYARTGGIPQPVRSPVNKHIVKDKVARAWRSFRICQSTLVTREKVDDRAFPCPDFSDEDDITDLFMGWVSTRSAM